MRPACNILCGIVLAVAILVSGCRGMGSSGETTSPEADEQQAELFAEPGGESATDLRPASYGGTWIVLGDSLTEAPTDSTSKRYYDYVAEDLGCRVMNYGKGGTGYKAPGWSEPFYDRIDYMAFAGVDCVTVFGSFNDLGKGYELGTAEDQTTDTIGGCMNLTLDKLHKQAPLVRVGIVTPTPWRTGYAFDSDAHGSDKATTREECNAYVSLLKKVAKRHHLPILDLYETCGFNPDDARDRELLFAENENREDGGVHPNSEGHRFMYPAWREFVLSLMPSSGA